MAYTVISSQRYLDDQIVQIKRDNRDYTVTVSPEFDIDGVSMRVVIDGHHSLAAAKADGVTPDFIEATIQDDDRIAMLDHNINDYLTVCYIDTDWYDISTGQLVF